MAARELNQQDLLRRLLRWHRQRLTRDEVGLPAGLRTRGRRHLSQEDVARLVGVSLRTINDLESGRSRPEPDLLDRVAKALRMYPDERRVLYELALGLQPALHAYNADPDPALIALVGHLPTPAVAIDAIMNVHAHNEAFADWFADLTPGSETGNFATWVCLDPHARHVIVEWAKVARRILWRLRGVAARMPDDPQVSHVLERVRADALVNDIWEETSWYYDPFVVRCSLRQPGATNPQLPIDVQRHVSGKLVAMSGPRLNDERRMVTFLFDDPAQLPATLDKRPCQACAQ